MASFNKHTLCIDGNLVDSATVSAALGEVRQRSPILEITLRNVSIDDVVSTAMDQLLQHDDDDDTSSHRIWTKLELSHCTGDIWKVLQSAASCDRIEQIYFAGTVPVAHNPRYCLDLPSLRAIKLVLQKCTRLSLLCLKGTRLGRAGMQLLSDGLSESKYLKTLRMSECAMEAMDMPLLASALSKNQQLTVLLFSSCKVGGAGLSERDDPANYFCSVLEAIRSHPTIEFLTVNGMDLTSRAADALANILRYPTTKLWHLGLKNNVHTPDRKLIITPIIDALKNNRTLKHLQISGNNVNNEDMERLAQVLASENSSLQGLSLPANSIRDEGLHSFRTRLSIMKGLRYLDLMRNHFSENAKNEIIEELKENFEIERLDLDGNFSSTKSFYLALNKGGRRLQRASGVPVGLWPVVFERANNLAFGRNLPNGNIDVLFCLVKGANIFEYASLKRQRHPESTDKPPDATTPNEDNRDVNPAPTTTGATGGLPPLKKKKNGGS